MFAVEIAFQDGVSETEMIFVRRPHALLGASDYAHVVVEDMRSLGYQLRLIREVGRSFRTIAVAADGQIPPSEVQGVFEGETTIDTGPVRLHITALDADLAARDGEAPDAAGVRIMRQAASRASPKFPAVVVAGSYRIVISFNPDQPIYIGRSKQCVLRFDSSDISARHARMGYELGRFWVEDLGSTNGTFIRGQQISGRVNVDALTPIVLGREISITPVEDEEQLQRSLNVSEEKAELRPATSRMYPALISASEIARPARVVLSPGSTVHAGRDPDSDMWLGAPHVSRRHFSVNMNSLSSLVYTDLSSNGTAYEGGVLKKGDILELTLGKPQVFDLGSGVTVALCFTEEQEKRFLGAQGSPLTFAEVQSDAHKSPVVGRSRQDTQDIMWERQPGAEQSRQGFLTWTIRFFRESGPLGKLAVFLMLFAFFAAIACVVLIAAGFLR